MNNEILNKFVEQMTKILESGSVFATKELPIICNEVLRFYFLYDVFAIGIMILCIFLSYYICNKFNIKIKNTKFKEDDSGDIIRVIIWFCYGVANIIFFISSCTYIIDLIKVIFAPRLYLLEFFAKMVR